MILTPAQQAQKDKGFRFWLHLTRHLEAEGAPTYTSQLWTATHFYNEIMTNLAKLLGYAQIHFNQEGYDIYKDFMLKRLDSLL